MAMAAPHPLAHYSTHASDIDAFDKVAIIFAFSARWYWADVMPIAL